MEGRNGYERDGKYVSELSTVLVATIQETKDRISLMENIFCNELFPNIQSKWKSMQEVYLEAQKAADDSWKEKEMSLLGEIEELESKNRMLMEENKRLREPDMRGNQDGYITQLVDGHKALELNIVELERDVKEKSVKLKEAQESAASLFNCAQLDCKKFVDIEKQLNEERRKTKGLAEDLESSKMEIVKLNEELRTKVREVDEAKILREDIWRKFEVQALKVTNYESVLNAKENEMKLQGISLKQLKESVNELYGELQIKSKEVIEGNKVQQQLKQQIEHKSSQLQTVEQLLRDQQCQNTKLSFNVKELEERVEQLQADLQDEIIDLKRKEESVQQLSHSIESQNRELVSEKAKGNHILEKYKDLRSQQKYLLKKIGLTSESITANEKEKADVNSVIPTSLTDMKGRDQNAHKLNDDGGLYKHQNDDERVRSGQASETSCRDFLNIRSSKKINREKTPSLIGTKRPASRWRDTRSNQNQDGPDPHDDFLNTPLENIRENLNKPIEDEVGDLPDNAPLEVNLSNSDDEVQKSAPPESKRQQKQPNSRGYKYVEPVRKKADRDNLKGVECKQCKKFYDAVLPNGGSSDKNLQCEHHDGVSRHRYKYIPPSTPEGFWNIGFDTENNSSA